MNKMRAKITDIKSVQNLNIVNFIFNNQTLSMVSLELSQDIKVGSEVYISAKATHIAIAKNFSGEISYSNQVKAKIISVNNGEILSSIIVNIGKTEIESVITASSSKRMKLEVNDEITLLIKSTELSISEVIS